MVTENKSIDNMTHFRYFLSKHKKTKVAYYIRRASQWETQGMSEDDVLEHPTLAGGQHYLYWHFLKCHLAGRSLKTPGCGWRKAVLKASQSSVTENTKSTQQCVKWGWRVSTMSQWVKALAAMPDDLSSISWSTWWKEIAKSYSLSSDLHTHIRACVPTYYTHIHTINKQLQLKEFNNNPGSGGARL